MEKMREELKSELSALGPRGRGRPYPKDLLERLLSYTVARRRQGAKLVEVATELGMQNHTLSRWLGEKRAANASIASRSWLPRSSRVGPNTYLRAATMAALRGQPVLLPH